MGATREEARDVASAALGQWEAVQAVSAIVLVQSAPKAQCSLERLLRPLRLSRADLEVQGSVLHCQPLTLGALGMRCRGGDQAGAAGPHAPHLLVSGRRRRAGARRPGYAGRRGEGGGGNDDVDPPPCRTPNPLGGRFK